MNQGHRWGYYFYDLYFNARARFNTIITLSGRHIQIRISFDERTRMHIY